MSTRPSTPPAPARPRVWEITLEAEPQVPSLRRTVVAGLVTVVLAFGGFLGWGFFARLDSAAIAPGVVTVDSHRKTVQHLEGGIVREVLVREGQRVAAGQVLIRLDTTQAEAVLGQVDSQYWAALARAARLRGEQEDRRSLTFLAELLAEAARQRAVAAVLETEQRLFEARWEALDGTIAVQRKRIAQLEEEIVALEAQARATADQLRLTREEMAGVRSLVAKGYERRPRLLELERTVAELEGRLGELKANLAKARQGIAAAELEIINTQNTRRTEIADQLQETQTLLGDLADRRRAALDVLARKEVVAPQDGLVVNLQVHTPGGVILAGMPLMDIVPLNDDLIIEAMVDPADIDVVRVGLPAHVRLTAYKQRQVPMVDGEVIHVSADKITDERTGKPYFLARVRLAPDALEGLARVELYPGMPAEVVMVTGERRAIDYFISPITDSMNRAFRED